MVDVTIRHLTKRYGESTVVDNVDVRIGRGEFFTFLGPSGCGKTTTLRIIAGLALPTSGQVLFDERDVTFLPPEKRTIGMVFQNYALFPHLSVGENVAFGLKLRKLDASTIRRKVEEALDLVHLSGLGKRRVNQISGGQQQRVALARALVINPDILLLDEPLSNLDARLRDTTRTEIRRLQLELGITTIYVTHDQAEALALSDRIMLMDHGVCQQIGRPEEIYTRPANEFVASFIGDNNILDAQVLGRTGDRMLLEVAGHLHLQALISNTNADAPPAQGARVRIAIRPEAFTVLGAASTGTGTAQQADTARIEGSIVQAEYSGTTTAYLVDVGGATIEASFVNANTGRFVRGQTIAMGLAPASIFIL